MNRNWKRDLESLINKLIKLNEILESYQLESIIYDYQNRLYPNLWEARVKKELTDFLNTLVKQNQLFRVLKALNFWLKDNVGDVVDIVRRK